MTGLSHWSRRVACAIGLLCYTLFATPTWAGVVYEYREVGSSTVIGTLEIASPPASATSGWSTVDSSDLIALSLDDGVFGLGLGNLLSIASTVSAAVLSLDGSNLDVGSVAVGFPTIPPVLPGDPSIDQFLSLLFGVPPGGDFIGVSTVSTFPGGGLLVGDLFSFGDWTVAAAAAPEPGTAGLLLMGLAAAGRMVRRRRRRRVSGASPEGTRRRSEPSAGDLPSFHFPSPISSLTERVGVRRTPRGRLRHSSGQPGLPSNRCPAAHE